MAIKDYNLKYGKGSVTVSIDESLILGELKGNYVPPIEDMKAAVYDSLDSPIEREPLNELAKKAKSITLVVSDMTRFWMRQDRVIPLVVEYLIEKCEKKYEDITILVANGTHTPGSEKDLRTIVTDDIYEKVKVVNHNARSKDMIYIGTTSFGTEVRVNPIAVNADLVICIGACAYHDMAGFGGGRKSILPGISAVETVNANHSLSLDPVKPCSNPLIGNRMLDDNPLNLDMCEAAAMMKNLFMVNLVTNGDTELCGIFSGHWKASWRKACDEMDKIYLMPVKEKADVIIASCGGYPKDISLYQGTKAIANMEPGLKPGGTLIVAMEAIEGGGPADYFDWMKSLKRGTLIDDLRAGFTIAGYTFFLNCEEAARYRIMLCTTAPADDLAAMGYEAYSDMDELMKNVDLEGKTVYVAENGGTVMPYVKG